MNTQNPSTLVAITVALVVNTAIFGGVAFLFNGQPHQVLEGGSVARASAPLAPLV